MNKWDKIAELFDLKLDEEFTLDKDKTKYKFSTRGILHFVEGIGWVSPHSQVLEMIVSGERSINYKRFKPNIDEIYFYLEYSKPSWRKWKEDYKDLTYWKAGNCFRNIEETKNKGIELMEEIRKEYQDE